MDGKNNNKIFANASSSFRSTVNLWIHQKNQSQNQNQNKEMETHWMLPQRMAENNTNLNFYWMNSKSRGVDTQMGRFNPINYETGLYKCEDVCVCMEIVYTQTQSMRKMIKPTPAALLLPLCMPFLDHASSSNEQKRWFNFDYSAYRVRFDFTQYNIL